MAKKQRKFRTVNLKNKQLLKEKFPLLKVIYLSLGLNIFVIIMIFVLENRLPPEIPLYYGLPEGSGQLTKQDNLIIPSILALIFILTNTVIAYLIQNDFLKRTLIITGFVLSIFSFITTLKIMLLVGNF